MRQVLLQKRYLIRTAAKTELLRNCPRNRPQTSSTKKLKGIRFIAESCCEGSNSVQLDQNLQRISIEARAPKGGLYRCCVLLLRGLYLTRRASTSMQAHHGAAVENFLFPS